MFQKKNEGETRMNKYKTIIAVLVISTVIATSALAASATLSSSTSVYWNARETQAWAETIGNSTESRDFYVDAYIQSNSTLDYQYEGEYSNGVYTGVTATTSPVNVTYPSPIPLVDYGGSHWYVD